MSFEAKEVLIGLAHNWELQKGGGIELGPLLGNS